MVEAGLFYKPWICRLCRRLNDREFQRLRIVVVPLQLAHILRQLKSVPMEQLKSLPIIQNFARNIQTEL